MIDGLSRKGAHASSNPLNANVAWMVPRGTSGVAHGTGGIDVAAAGVADGGALAPAGRCIGCLPLSCCWCASTSSGWCCGWHVFSSSKALATRCAGEERG